LINNIKNREKTISIYRKDISHLLDLKQNIIENIKDLEYFKPKLCYIHGDLQKDNILILNNKIKLIDLEFSIIGDSAYDLCKLYFEKLFLKYKDLFLKECINITKDYNIEKRIKIHLGLKSYDWILGDLKSYFQRRSLAKKELVIKEIKENYNYLNKKKLTKNITLQSILELVK
jgi:thiamine kinase-like enzyme